MFSGSAFVVSELNLEEGGSGVDVLSITNLEAIESSLMVRAIEHMIVRVEIGISIVGYPSSVNLEYGVPFSKFFQQSRKLGSRKYELGIDAA